MKTSLWVVIVVVSGIVGFLVGYSVSSYTGMKHIAADVSRHEDEKVAAQPPEKAEAHPSQPSGGYGGGAATPAPSGSYGAVVSKPGASGGYGGATPAPVKPAPVSPAPVKPASAGGYR